jgi:sulfite reductase (NADPH) flavoprotein alpha-component
MSANPVALPPDAPLSPEQRAAFQGLLPTLAPSQAAWLSGYFSALGQLSLGATPSAPAMMAAPAAAAAVTAPSVPLTILFGSESGNAEGCAQRLELAAKAEGFVPTVADMADFDPARLSATENLLIVVSTWGEGDPPERATGFYEAVMGEAAPRLSKTRFSVCALGDTSYADFCQCGRDFDRRLAELGASRVFDRFDLDVDFEAPFENWKKGALAAMVKATGLKEAALAAAARPAVAVVVQAPAAGTHDDEGAGWSKKHPYEALIKERLLLNGPGSKKETIHVEIDLGDSGLAYEPGDVLGAFPSNCPDVVEDFIRAAGFRGDELRENETGEFFTLSELLAHYDITSLSKSFLKKFAPLAKNPELDAFLDEGNKDVLSDWLWGRELRDLFLEFPSSDPLSIDQLVGLLRSQPPRLYSIASSLKAHPGEVHLTIAAVKFHAHGRDRKGVCSTFFSERAGPGDRVPVYLHHNKNFKLPVDPSTPVIMVGPGTGIAPFRAFVEERAAIGAPGKNWLFFGDWTFQNDFLYQLEWQKYLKSGTLARMDVAFSRDLDHKVYVQDRMREHARDLYAWLEEGAHFYVCGDAKRMAKDVHQALLDAVAQQGGRSPEEAEAYVKQLQKDKRYQRDVY